MKVPKRLAGLRFDAGSTVVLQIPYYWGKGPTMEAAVAALRKAGGKTGGDIVVISSPTDRVWVDEHGRLCWYLPPGLVNSGVRPKVVYESRSEVRA